MNVFRKKPPRVISRTRAETKRRELESSIGNLSRLIGAVTVLLLIYLVYFALHYHGLVSLEALDSAQMAESLALGRGFVTRAIEPVNLIYVDADLHEYPALVRPPAYPLILSVFFRLFGSASITVSIAAGLFLLLTAALAYNLGLSLGGKTTGTAAFFAVGLSPALLQAAVNGSHFVSQGFFLLALFWVAVRMDDKGWSRSLVLGLLAAVLALFDYLYLAMIPVIFWRLAAVGPEERGKRLAAFSAGLLAAGLPWLFRNAAATGRGVFFSMQFFNYKLFTESFPGNTFFRSAGDRIFLIDFSRWEVIVKALADFPRLYLGLLVVWQSAIGAFFIAHLFSARRRRFRELYLLALPSAALIFAAVSMTTLDLRSFLPFLPLVVLGGCDYFAGWLENRPRPPRSAAKWIAGFVALNTLVTGQRLLLPSPSEDYPRAEAFASLQRLVDPEEAVFTDNPWLVSWKGQRTSVWLPYSLDEFVHFLRVKPEVRFVLLTPEILRWPHDEEATPWQEIYVNRAFPRGYEFGFDMVVPLPGDYLLFGDSQRLQFRMMRE